jgi:bifunctional ADP-heptose synthase (sugar kinase/adenylyltransferase)
MNKKILIIGDSCKDVYTYCNVKRLSPEKPVPVLEIDHVEEMPGMAMNVYRNVCSMISENMVDIITNYNWESITKNRFVDEKSNHMFCRVDTPQFVEPINVFDINLSEYSYVIISDYDKGFIYWDDIDFICHHHDSVFLDTKKTLDFWACDARYIKINNFEAERSPEFVDKLGSKVIQTMGNGGAYWNGNVYPVKNKVETLDVSGAGDTFLASLVVSYSRDRDIINAIMMANKMASRVVSKRGTSVPE